MIRTARIEDLAEIVNIYNESIPGRKATADTEEVSIESRLFWFQEHKDKRPLWVIECDGIIAGWLSFQNFYGRPAYQKTAELSIYIKSSFQQQGIAKTLMAHALNMAPKLHIDTLLGFIFAHNKPSIALFKQYGFKEWGYLPQVARLDDEEKDLTIYGLRIAD